MYQVLVKRISYDQIAELDSLREILATAPVMTCALQRRPHRRNPNNPVRFPIGLFDDMDHSAAWRPDWVSEGTRPSQRTTGQLASWVATFEIGPFAKASIHNVNPASRKLVGQVLKMTGPLRSNWP